MASFLTDLRNRLTRGLERFGPSFREHQTAFLLARQQPDGGFAGRGGPSDLYYTAFGLRALGMLGVTDPSPWCRAARFLVAHLDRASGIADAVSLLEAAALVKDALGTAPLEQDGRLRPVRDLVYACRTARGAFAPEPGGAASLYHTFLGTLCLGMLNELPTRPRRWVRRLVRFQNDDGSFSDGRDGPTGGTNPTAAGVTLLAEAGDAATEAIERASAFLTAQQRPDGGFAAHADAPSADLLSTFTALVALQRVDQLRRVRLADVGRFVRGLDVPSGGFWATPEDDDTDVEYTYYGLGTLGLLAGAVADRPGS